MYSTFFNTSLRLMHYSSSGRIVSGLDQFPILISPAK